MNKDFDEDDKMFTEAQHFFIVGMFGAGLAIAITAVGYILVNEVL